MSWFTKAISGGVSEIVDSVGNTSVKLRTAITGDMPPETKEKLMEITGELSGQVNDMVAKLNIIEAGKSLFHSGWRPFIGWICGFTILHEMLIRKYVNAFTTLNIGEVDQNFWTVVGLMLGMGVLRTYDKIKGTAKN